MKTYSVDPNPSRFAGMLRIDAACTALLLTNCGGGAEVLFIPFFSFGFTGAVTLSGNVGTTVNMSLKSSDACSPSGSLPSANLSLSNGGGSSNITGSYQQRSVTITLATPPVGLAATYDGQFTDRDTLAFTPRGVGAAFTVTRINVGAALPTCPA